MALEEFMSEYKWILLFYLVVVIVIYFNRKKFDFQAKIIALYRTKFGLAFIDREASRFRQFWVLFGYSAIGIGFVSMIIISYMLVDALWNLVTVPDAAPGISLILPGVKIPGSPIFVPFWYGIIALFIVVLIHESAHGLVARAYKIPVKSTGIVFFGPLIGAFVEPDEKVLRKADEIKQFSVYAAGPFSNIVLAGLIAIVMILVINPIQGAMAEPYGFSFEEIQDDYPAMTAGVEPGMIFTTVNGKDASSAQVLLDELSYARPGETLVLAGPDGSKEIILAAHPDDERRGYLGIVGISTETKLVSENIVMRGLSSLIVIIQTLFKWIVVLSLGIGLANLLPLGPVDGGRMLLLALQGFYDNKKADMVWKKISVITLVILLMNLMWPAFRWFGGLF